MALLVAGSSGQPPNCRNYIRCYEATGGMKGALDSSYGASGACWQNSTTAETCIDDCLHKLTMLRAANPDAGCAEPVWPQSGCGCGS